MSDLSKYLSQKDQIEQLQKEVTKLKNMLTDRDKSISSLKSGNSKLIRELKENHLTESNKLKDKLKKAKAISVDLKKKHKDEISAIKNKNKRSKASFIKTLLLRHINGDESIKVTDLADICCVSTTAIYNEIREVKKQLCN